MSVPIHPESRYRSRKIPVIEKSRWSAEKSIPDCKYDSNKASKQMVPHGACWSASLDSPGQNVALIGPTHSAGTCSVPSMERARHIGRICPLPGQNTEFQRISRAQTCAVDHFLHLRPPARIHHGNARAHCVPIDRPFATNFSVIQLFSLVCR